MSQLSLKEISKAMQDIDICMLTTKTPSGELESRPMSNNRQVEYDGDSYFFSLENFSAVREIQADSQVCLSFVHQPALAKNFYLSVTGHAEIIQDRQQFEKHWVKDLEVWFEKGIDTPGLVLIKVRAERLKYWKGQEEGILNLKQLSRV